MKIGFDRYIKLDWLDSTAELVANRTDSKEVLARIHLLLEPEYQGYESRKKTATILQGIWLKIGEEHKPIRERALRLLPLLPPNERIWVHWGMINLSYPFFTDVLRQINHYFQLTGSCRVNLVTQNIQKKWGYGQTTERATRRTIQSIESWKVVTRSGDRIYQAPKISSTTKETELWLLEALLISNPNNVVLVDRLNGIPSLFPFKLTINAHDILSSKRFSISQVGNGREVSAIMSSS